MTIQRVELGCPGHLIIASLCRWRRHTQVANYRVSTVGDYYLPKGTERQTLGAEDDSFFETMVFRTSDVAEPQSEGCGCRRVDDYGEIDCARYATAGEARAGHERHVAKYVALAAAEEISHPEVS